MEELLLTKKCLKEKNLEISAYITAVTILKEKIQKLEQTLELQQS